MFDDEGAVSGGPESLSFEHFLPSIWKLVLAYQDQEQENYEQMLPQCSSIQSLISVCNFFNFFLN